MPGKFDLTLLRSHWNSTMGVVEPHRAMLGSKPVWAAWICGVAVGVEIESMKGKGERQRRLDPSDGGALASAGLEGIAGAGP